uniref:Uncharacterized protein n=1 Tax=Arion vulgaris TaxID=1028688 RepID=A0A0B7APX8_9EUPU
MSKCMFADGSSDLLMARWLNTFFAMHIRHSVTIAYSCPACTTYVLKDHEKNV